MSFETLAVEEEEFRSEPSELLRGVMESNDELNNDTICHNAVTETSETMANKRARRVSFAERTSVHFFDRDEECHSTPSLGTGSVVHSSSEKSRSGSKGLESNDDEDSDAVEIRRSFLRPDGSPSPGGSTVGSASSFNEDDFFGAVSAHFIRPGLLSDSAASNDDHDVTMDSTVFSLHYRSLARSDSDAYTPSKGRLSLETTPTSEISGSMMAYTLNNRVALEFSMPEADGNCKSSSSDMSIIGETDHNYDYEKLSPGLDALLVESKKILRTGSSADDIASSESPRRDKDKVLPSAGHTCELAGLRNDKTKEPGRINSESKVNGDVYVLENGFSGANGHLGNSTGFHTNEIFSPSGLDGKGCVTVSDISPCESAKLRPHVDKTELETKLMLPTSPVKPGQVLSNGCPPVKHFHVGSALMKQTGSSFKREMTEPNDAETFLGKEVLKSGPCERSVSSSAFAAKVDISTIRALDLVKSPIFDAILGSSLDCPVAEVKYDSSFQSKDKVSTVLSHLQNDVDESPITKSGRYSEPLRGEKSSIELGAKNLSPTFRGTFAPPSRSSDSPVSEIKHSSSFQSKDKVSTLLNHLQHDAHESPIAKCDEDSSGRYSEPLTGEKSLIELGAKNLSPTFRGTVAPPSMTTWSDNYLVRSLFSPRTSIKDSMVAKTVSSLGKNASGDGRLTQSTKIFSSPRTLEKSFPASPSIQSSHPGRFYPKFQSREGSEFNSSPRRNLADSTLPAASDNRDVASKGTSVLNLPLPGVARQYTLSKLKKSGNGIIDINKKEKVLGNVDTSTSHNQDKLWDSNHGNVSDVKQTSMKSSGFGGNPSNEQLRNIPHDFEIPGRRDAEKRNALKMIEGSPKRQKVDELNLGMLLRSNVGRMTISTHEASSLVDIDAVEDILISQHRSRMYDELHLELLSQNTSGLHGAQHEKVIQAKSLLREVVFEKAKLQLKCLKKDKILKKLQVLSSRIQESQVMKANILSQTPPISSAGVLAEAAGYQSSSENLKSVSEVTPEKMAAMKHVFDALEMEISNLMRNLHECCELNAAPNIGGRIASINKNLIRSASRQIICKDIRNWVVHTLSSMNGQQNIGLSYLGLITQSLRNICRLKSLATSVILNEANIIKCFPNMEACIAFAYVFNPESISGVTGPRTLMLETQVTSSLFGNLLDVIEEVHILQMELHNLMESRFCSSSAGRLHLMFSFFGFKTASKVTLALDVTCLKRGIYPSDVVPVQLNCSTEPMLNVIRKELEAVEGGYMRIFRVCRTVSQSLDSMEIM